MSETYQCYSHELVWQYILVMSLKVDEASHYK